MSPDEFLAMGGYGPYVWPCFLLTGAVLAWNLVTARRLHADARRRALARLERDAGRP